MDEILSQALDQIRQGDYSVAVLQNGAISQTAPGRGIRPILDLYDAGLLNGAVVCDRIVGKAAAMIFVLGGVEAVYGLVVSAAARTYLLERGIPVWQESGVAQIINRTGTGMCPMEETVLALEDPEVGRQALLEKLAQLQGGAPGPS